MGRRDQEIIGTEREGNIWGRNRFWDGYIGGREETGGRKIEGDSGGETYGRGRLE